MLPTITITDAATARLVATALRENADAKRRTADRLASPAFASVSAANVRNAARLVSHAQRLDNIAGECDRQAAELESGEGADDYATDVIPLFDLDSTRRMPAVVGAFNGFTQVSL